METKKSNKGVIFWLLFLSYVTIYMARLNLSMASPALRESGVLNAAQLGFIGSAFSVIYSCGRLFNGILGDRLAPKVMILTGLVFRDMNKALYTGITVYLCGKMVDAVVYRFDYSKVAMIISKEYETIAKEIGRKLDRGATFLHGEGSYTGEGTKVVLVAIRKQQLAELKELVMELDPGAFVIVQEAHQVLGDGFIRYSKDAL
jgi:uncharacterized protein YebE (UPF0316 family)